MMEQANKRTPAPTCSLFTSIYGEKTKPSKLKNDCLRLVDVNDLQLVAWSKVEIFFHYTIHWVRAAIDEFAVGVPDPDALGVVRVRLLEQELLTDLRGALTDAK